MSDRGAVRSVGRPLKGKQKRVRVSFTLSANELAWLKSRARASRQSSSQTLDAALAHFRQVCGLEGSPLRKLVLRYPSIFWDIEADAVDQDKHVDFVIERVLELGSLASVKDLMLVFSSDRIVEVIRRSRRISRKTARFWAIRLGIEGGIRCLEEELPSQLSKPWR